MTAIGVVNNTTAPHYRTIPFELYAPNGDPFAGSLTGVKFYWKLDGAGAEQESDADLERPTAGQATVLGILTQAESATLTAEHNVLFYVKPVADT